MSYERLTFVAYDPHFSLASVRWHQHDRKRFETYAVLAVQRAVKQGSHAEAKLEPYLLKWASDPRLLRNVWERLARYGGGAPGPNGLRYSDLGAQETWSLLKALSTSVRSGKYRAQPAKRIWVPKDPLQPDRGSRPISLINVEDRTLQRAIVELVLPLREPRWDDNVYGSRQGRSRFHALARLEWLATESKRWVWIADDVRDAFENVPRSRLRDLLLKRVPGKELVDLIIMLINNGQKHGILQGGPLSPLMLNEYLDHFLDKFWRKALPAIPLLRYVDDLLALCKTKKEAEAAWQTLRQRLVGAGMQLKGESPVRDLRKGESVEWLGFLLSRADGELQIRITPKAWSRLHGKLVLTHELPNAPLRAIDTIQGWIDQLGPAYRFENRSAVLRRIARMAKAMGFDEIPGQPALRARWRRAHLRWQKVRDEAVTVAPPPAPKVLLISDGDPNSPPFDFEPVEDDVT